MTNSARRQLLLLLLVVLLVVAVLPANISRNNHLLLWLSRWIRVLVLAELVRRTLETPRIHRSSSPGVTAHMSTATHWVAAHLA